MPSAAKRHYQWSHYNLHKDAAKRHFAQGQLADARSDFDAAYKHYCQAYDARLKADHLWVLLRGPGQADAGHASMTRALITRYRDSADQQRRGSRVFGSN